MTEDGGENRGTWVAHRGAAIVLRTIIFLIPVVLSVLGTAIISRALPPPSSTAVLILWWVLLSIAATSILYMTDKVARQLLPLHALLNLSLIFPDRAPSRFKAALRSPGVRQLERRIADVKANGLGDSETEAAETLVELIGALAHHDRLTRGHAERVRAYSRMIGEEMGLDDDAINKLSWAGLMHDVGKLFVPSEILNKEGTLTADEFEVIKTHPAAGAELVEPLADWLGEWVRAVGEHHERWDGGGYPAGLAGEEIALGARIVSVADAFDVLTSARSYKAPGSAAAARAEIQRCAGTQFDATVVRAFLNISVGRFRLVMGPLSWLAQAPVIGVPVAPAIGAMAGGFATAAGLLVGGFFQPPAIDSGPASVIAAPAVVTPVDTDVVATTSSSSTTTSTSSTSTTTTSTTAPPTTSTTAPPTTTTTVVEFFPDTFETPNIPAPHQPPVVVDDTFAGIEDTPSIFAPLANDGNGLTISGVTQPSAGTVTIRLDSTVRFDPPANWWGTTSFTYEAKDARGLTSTAKVTVDYRNVPDAPQTQNDWLIRAEDSPPTTIDVTANDSDADLHGVRVISITRVPSASPSLGSASITSSGLVRFAPNPDAFGNDVYVYFVQDPDGLTASGLLTVTLTAVNDPPIARNDVGSMNEDTVKTFAVRSNDYDIDGGPLTTTSATSAHGSASTNGTTVTYRPAPDSFGTQTVRYTISDGRGGTASAILTINVAPVNDAPVARNDNGSMTEDNPAKLFSVLDNDTDIDGGPLSITSVSSAFGTATTNGSTVSYRPNPNGNGIHTVSYTVSDGRGGTDSATLRINVAAVNDPPSFTAGGDDTVAEDSGPRTVSGWATDISPGPIDEWGQALSFSVTAADPTLFSVQPSANATNGTLTYTPAPDANGITTLTVTLSDSGGATSAPQTADVVIIAVNDAPSFSGGSDQTVAEDSGSQTVNGWATDISAGPANETTQTVTFTVTSDNPGLFSTQPAITPTGTLTYTPTPNGNGTANLSVTLTDSAGATSAPQTATIEVTPVNDPPSFTAGGDDTVVEDSGPRTVAGWATAISAGPLDELAQTLTFDVTADDPTLFSTQPSVDETSGDLAYTPAPDANGITTISVTLSDSEGATTAPQTADIVITHVNDPPTFTAGPDDTVAEDAGPQTVAGWATAISAGPANESSQTLTFDVTSDDPTLFSTQPAVDETTGDLTYTPTPDANGTATITVTLNDSQGGASTPQTADIAITPVNDPPSFTTGADDTVAEDSGPRTVAGWATDISPGPADESGQTLTFDVTADDPSLFSAQPSIDEVTGDLTYTPGPNANGTTTLTITLSDSAGGTSPAQTADIIISAVNDLPEANPESYSTPEGTALTVVAPGLLANDSDADKDPLTVLATPASGPSVGVLALSADGSFTYTPDASFVGTDSFIYQLSDGVGPPVTAQVDVFVNSGITNQGWYLGTSGTNANTWDLVGAPLPVAEPEPDHDPDPDGDPGLTIKSSNLRLSENDPRKSQHWTLAPTSPLVLEGPVVLDLWSSVKDFDDDEELEYSVWLHDCATNGTDCQLILSTGRINVDEWNGETPDWVFKSLLLGSIDHTVVPGRMIRLRLMFDKDDAWIAASGNRPSQLVLPLANTAPVAGDDSFTLVEDAGPTVLNVLANDSDATLDPASVSVVAPGPSLGGAAAQPDGTIVYTPAADENGPDGFDYEVCDSAGLCTTATVDITITPVNDPPSFTAGADEVVAEDSGPQTAAGWATGISAGPANESSQTLTFDVTADDPSLFSTQPSIDEVTGDLTYTPGPNENGTTTLTITLSDSGGATSAPQTADITISAANDAPALDPIGDKSGDELTTISFTATATDSDLPPDTLTFSLTGEPAGASIGPSSGVFSWTPTEAQGPGTFTFDVTVADDGTPVGSDTETITITVAEVNADPTIGGTTAASVSSGASVEITSAMLSATDPDLPAQSLTFSLATAPVNGAVERSGSPLAAGATFTPAEIAAGDITYRHGGGATSFDAFSVTVSDGAGGSDGPTSFGITVAVASPSAITISEIRTDSILGNDFVELYNGSGAAIDLAAGGWQLDIEDVNGSLVETLPLTGVLPANGYALITEATYFGFGTPDVKSSLGAFDRGFGFRVRQGATVVDAVGTSSGSSWAEGTPLPRMGGVLPQSFNRFNGPGRGACVDTDDNASDFEHLWGLGSTTPTGIADGGAVGCLPPATPPPPPAPAGRVVIKEFRTDGPGGGGDEFIEFFNAGPDQLMDGWTLHRNQSPFATVYTFPTGFVFESGRHYLIAGPNYTGTTTPDATYSVQTVTNGSGMYLWAGGLVRDAIGIETGTFFYEPVIGPGMPRIDGRTYHSYERKNGGCTDTNNNLADFEHHLGFETPTNNSAAPTPCV